MTAKNTTYNFLLCLAITIAVLGAMVFEIYPLEFLEYKVYDRLIRLKHRAGQNSVIIAAIDNESLQAIGSWPWPRSYIADMVRQLSAYETHTLGFSLMYPAKELNDGLHEIQNFRASQHETPLVKHKKTQNQLDGILAQIEGRIDHDRQLIAAVRSARNVVLPLQFRTGNKVISEIPKLSGWLRMNSIAVAADKENFGIEPAPSAKLANIIDRKSISADRITQPFNDLSRKAGALGHILLIADRDGILRRAPMLVQYQNRNFLSFPLQVARKYLRMRLREIHPDAGGISIKHLRIPTDRHYSMLIDYSGQKKSIQKISFADIRDGIVPAETFRKKIVLIGITADGITSGYQTAAQQDVAAVEIAANVVENIVNQKHISRPFWGLTLEILVLLYFGFFLLFVVPKVTARMGALILGIFLITWVGTATILFMTNGIWLRIVAPILLSIIGFALTVRKKRSIEKEAETVELNKTLGLSLQGQGMLDMAFDKFLKCPIQDKSVHEPLYNLGLDFERKRMFNKALAVYKHILKAGAFKDIKERIRKLESIDKTLALPANKAKQEAALLTAKGTTSPTLGRYEILKELGHGAMGNVYFGKDPNINREVAIKTLNYTDVEDDQLEEVKSQFFREAEAAGKLSHPNIVTIYDVGEDHDMAFIAMELLKGKDLTCYCRTDNLLPTHRVLHIIAAVADALDYAHGQGVVHRDIKPANIILADNDQVKVADFGIARVVSSSKTQTGVIFGTPSYMSPEQVAGKKVDGRSDLFSLGIVFYELLTGKKPFKGETITSLMYAIANADYEPITEIAPRTPVCCIEIVEKMMARGLTKRYKSAAIASDGIRRCQESQQSNEKTI